MKGRKMVVVVGLLIVVLGLVAIRKENLTSSFLLEPLSGTQDYRGYAGATMDMEGYAIRFPFRLYYAKGSATINDHVYTISRLKYSFREGRYSMGLHCWFDDDTGTGTTSATLEYWVSSESYLFGTPWGSYSATTLTDSTWGRSND